MRNPHVRVSATFRCAECGAALWEVRREAGALAHDLRCPRCDHDLLVQEGVAPRCPGCAGRLVPLVYGHPTPDVEAAAARGELAFGGCVVGADAPPRFRCVECGESTSEQAGGAR